MVGGVQLRDGGTVVLFQGIQLRLLVTAEAVGVDELQDGDLLLVIRLAAGGYSPRRRGMVVTGRLEKPLADARMRDIPAIAGCFFLNLKKIIAPFGTDAGRVLEERLVQVFNKAGVGAVQTRRFWVAHCSSAFSLHGIPLF